MRLPLLEDIVYEPFKKLVTDFKKYYTNSSSSTLEKIQKQLKDLEDALDNTGNSTISFADLCIGDRTDAQKGVTGTLWEKIYDVCEGQEGGKYLSQYVSMPFLYMEDKGKGQRE
jgi:hypothetical protein